MTSLLLKHYIKKALVIGPIYDQLDKLHRIKERFLHYDAVIFNGNLSYPCHNLENVEYRLNIMNQYLTDNPKIFYNLGNYDLQLLRQLDGQHQYNKIYEWLITKPNVIMIEFPSLAGLIITCGGIAPSMKRSDLHNNIETSFISKIGDMIWHKGYGGSWGYVISNNPLTTEPPKTYHFSMQIGNKYDENANVYAIEISDKGIEETFEL